MPPISTAQDIADRIFGLNLTGKDSDQLVMKIVSEDQMGYVNYGEEDYYNPIRSVTHHPSKEREPVLKHQVRHLIRLEVPEKTGMGIHELLSLPIDLYDIIVGEVREAKKDEHERHNEVQEEMEKAMERLKELQENKEKQK